VAIMVSGVGGANTLICYKSMDIQNHYLDTPEKRDLIILHGMKGLFYIL
jgi:hypothetical protein